MLNKLAAKERIMSETMIFTLLVNIITACGQLAPYTGVRRLRI